MSRPIVRFEPTLVCERLNPIDGNDKPQARLARPDEADVVGCWSMTPSELAQAASGEKTWDSIYEADAARFERREGAIALVDALIAEVTARSAHRTGRS